MPGLLLGTGWLPDTLALGRYYTEVLDLSYLLGQLADDPFAARYKVGRCPASVSAPSPAVLTTPTAAARAFTCRLSRDKSCCPRLHLLS